MTKQIPQGYKQTKVGIIPEDWDVVKFSALINDFRGGAPLKPSDFTNAGIKVLSKGGIVPGGVLRISRHNQQYCSIDYYEKYKNNSIDNTYVIVVLRDLVPSGPSIGLMVKYYSSEKYLLAQGVYGIRYDLAKICENYMIQLSNSDWYRKLMNEIMVGSTQVHITNTEFLKQVMPLPQLKEQEKIAEILSTWDDAITKQEQLIKQKQVFKKGIMQQIFSQKIRFKDDNGNDHPAWQTKKLGEIAKISTGGSNREDSTEEDGKYTFFDRSQDIRTSNIYLFDCEAVIVAGEGQEFIPKYFIGKFDLHQRTYAIYDFINASGLFIYYYLHQNKNYFISQSVGSTVKSLRLPMFIKMSINLPTLEEQTKIADFLTSIDNEITKQIDVLNQLKLQKQSLMQKLLTGQVRTKI